MLELRLVLLRQTVSGNVKWRAGHDREKLSAMQNERELVFVSMNDQGSIVAYCSECHRRFIVTPSTGERVDDTILRLRKDFAEHDCRGDSDSG